MQNDNININIQELLVEGISQQQAASLGANINKQLTKIIYSDSMVSTIDNSKNIAQFDMVVSNKSKHLQIDSIAQQTAQMIYSALKQ